LNFRADEGSTRQPSLAVDRRNFIKIIAAGGIVSLLQGCDEMPASAIAPWNGPSHDLTDIRLRALSWAILAPNPHNLQSWMADVREKDTVRLLVDQTRLLKETDPENRQILIGCGAFLELFGAACTAYGHRADVHLFPEGSYSPHSVDHRPFAEIRVESTASFVGDSGIFQVMRDRRSAKMAYSRRTPSADDFAALANAFQFPLVEFGHAANPAEARTITDLAKNGYAVEFGNRRTLQESLHAIRLGTDAIARDPSGIALHGPLFWWGRKLGLIDDKSIADPDNPRVRASLGKFAEVLDQTPSWGWLRSKDNSRLAQIEAGRAYLRVNLEAARRGLAVHPNSQVLEEFSEMNQLFSQFHRQVGVSAPERVQMLFRIGFCERPSPPTPRRALENIVIT